MNKNIKLANSIEPLQSYILSKGISKELLETLKSYDTAEQQARLLWSALPVPVKVDILMDSIDDEEACTNLIYKGINGVILTLVKVSLNEAFIEQLLAVEDMFDELVDDKFLVTDSTSTDVAFIYLSAYDMDNDVSVTPIKYDVSLSKARNWLDVAVRHHIKNDSTRNWSKIVKLVTNFILGEQ